MQMHDTDVEFGQLGFPKVRVNPNPSYSDRWDYRVTGFYSSLVERSDIGKNVYKRFQADRRLSVWDGEQLSRGVYAYRLDLKFLAAWWLWRANEAGEQVADENLNDFIEQNVADMLAVVWLYGILPSARTEISEKIHLVSLQDMPESREKEEYLRLRSGIRSGVSALAPTAALVCRLSMPKVVGNDAVLEGAETIHGIWRKMTAIATLLNALPGTCCAVGYRTAYDPPEVPLGPFGGQFGSFPLLDSLPDPAPFANETLQPLISRLADSFFKLSPQDQQRIGRALHRLSQAKSKKNAADRALDLGVALEMLLLNSEHQNQELPGQLSLHFQLRGSWLLGSTGEKFITCSEKSTPYVARWRTRAGRTNSNKWILRNWEIWSECTSRQQNRYFRN